jgi:O-acetyl-ADP-ribose deacetylase (regulator of RNase III)
VITPAGDLAEVDWVIHAVGPEYQQYYLHQSKLMHSPTQATALLAKTYQDILRLAESKRVEALALPAISIGVGNFPLEEAAGIALAAMAEAGPQSSLKSVEFVLLERRAYRAWTDAAKAVG